MAKQKIREVLGFDDRWVAAATIPVLAFLIPILFFNATLEDGFTAYIPEFMTSLVFTSVYWLSMRRVFIEMRRRFPKHTQVRRRLIYTGIAVLMLFTLLHFLLSQVHDLLQPHPDRPGVTDFNYAVASLTIILLVSAIYEGVYLYDRWRESVIEQERLRRETIESQLEGLRSQVNPHFLFNSLNTLVCIIPEDPGRAVHFVRKLSKVYRYILEIRDQKLISLRDELRFLDAYIFLVKERFGDNLEINISISEALFEEKIVPLSLQMLFENALKHNIISSEHPLTIEVFVDGRRLVVRNNLQRKHQEIPSTRIGLENIKSRYAFYSEAPVEISEMDGCFVVKLPLLQTEAISL